MKIILAIMCGLVVLFAGGCAVVILFSGFTSGGALLAIVPGAIAALNVLVLMGLYGSSAPQPAAFYVLAVLDVVAAAILAMGWTSFSFQVNDIWTLALPGMIALLVKAVLTVLLARRLPKGTGNPPQG